MRHEELSVCEHCGKEFVSRRLGARFCSHICANQRPSGRKDYTQKKVCPYNIAVECDIYQRAKCESCGWNPKVEQKRREAKA